MLKHLSALLLLAFVAPIFAQAPYDVVQVESNLMMPMRDGDVLGS